VKIFCCDAFTYIYQGYMYVKAEDGGRKFSETLANIYQIYRSHLAEDSDILFILVRLFLCNL